MLVVPSSNATSMTSPRRNSLSEGEVPQTAPAGDVCRMARSVQFLFYYLPARLVIGVCLPCTTPDLTVLPRIQSLPSYRSRGCSPLSSVVSDVSSISLLRPLNDRTRAVKKNGYQIGSRFPAVRP